MLVRIGDVREWVREALDATTPDDLIAEIENALPDWLGDESATEPDFMDTGLGTMLGFNVTGRTAVQRMLLPPDQATRGSITSALLDVVDDACMEIEGVTPVSAGDNGRIYAARGFMITGSVITVPNGRVPKYSIVFTVRRDATLDEGHRADDFPPHPRRDAAMDELLRHVPPWIRVELPTAGESGRHRRNSPLNVQIEFTLGAQTAARRLESAPGEPGNALLKFMEDLIEDIDLEAQYPDLNIFVSRIDDGHNPRIGRHMGRVSVYFGIAR